MAAARVEGFACAVPYYGGGMTDAIAEQPKCPVMAHFGERDSMIPVTGVNALAAAHPSAQVFIYQADHGFNCDQRGSHDPASARLARERTLAPAAAHRLAGRARAPIQLTPIHLLRAQRPRQHGNAAPAQTAAAAPPLARTVASVLRGRAAADRGVAVVRHRQVPA
jgi:dienelactone hydrolase